jgi:hypothetical protein
MAVLANAEPMDLALDELARRVSVPIDTAREALQVMSWWQIVFDGAMRTNDVPLAVLAAREWRQIRRAAQLLGLAPP